MSVSINKIKMLFRNVIREYGCSAVFNFLGEYGCSAVFSFLAN